MQQPEKGSPIDIIITSKLAELNALQVQGLWLEAEEGLDQLISELGPTPDSLSARGLVRKVSPIRRNYTGAEEDFTLAASLAQTTHDPERELIAVVGLMDLSRTGDRDPNYARGKDLDYASELQTRAEQIASTINGESFAKAKALNEFGLLATERGEFEEALEHHRIAEGMSSSLLSQDPEIYQITQTDIQKLPTPNA